jgi:hypothetical protein
MTRLHPIPKFGKIKITKIFSSYLNQTRLAYGFLKRYSLGQVAFEERAIWVDTALLETLSKRKGFDSIQGLVGYEEVIEFPGMSDPVEVMLREKSTVPDVLRPRQIFDEIAYYLLRAEVPKLTLFTGNELRYTASKVKDPNTRLNTALQELSNGKIYLVAVEENDALRTKLEAPHAELFRLVHPNLDEKQIIVVDINSLNFMAEGLNEP